MEQSQSQSSSQSTTSSTQGQNKTQQYQSSTIVTPFEYDVIKYELKNALKKDFYTDKKTLNDVVNLVLYNLHLRKMQKSEIVNLLNHKILLPTMKLNIPHYYVFDSFIPPSYFLKCALLLNKHAKYISGILLKNVFGERNE